MAASAISQTGFVPQLRAGTAEDDCRAIQKEDGEVKNIERSDAKQTRCHWGFDVNYPGKTHIDENA